MAFVLRLAFLSCLAHCVNGHGYLTHPTSRRLAEKKSQYTGITAFGAGQHITNCGKGGLSAPSSQDVVTDLQKGAIMKFDVVIDAHHAGHLEMRLCPFIVDGDDQDLSPCTLLQRASAAEAGVSDCGPNDDRDICAPIDPNNPGWWYLAPKGPQGNVHSMWFHIPSNVNCPNDRCTVQFTWKTANSCNPHPAAYCNYYHNVVGPQNTWCNNWYCGGSCNSNSNSADNCEATMGNRLCCSEVFTNCAEVKLIGEGRPLPSPSPTTTAEPEPEPEPEPTVAPTERPTVAPTVAPTLAPTVAPTLAPTSSSTSFARTEWWPGCGCGPVTWITDHKSKESCELALCEVALITRHQSSWQDDGSVARQIESDVAESEQTNRRGKEPAPSQATHDKRKTHGFLQLSLMQAWAHMETVPVNSIQEKRQMDL